MRAMATTAIPIVRVACFLYCFFKCFYGENAYITINGIRQKEQNEG